MHSRIKDSAWFDLIRCDCGFPWTQGHGRRPEAQVKLYSCVLKDPIWLSCCRPWQNGGVRCKTRCEREAMPFIPHNCRGVKKLIGCWEACGATLQLISMAFVGTAFFRLIYQHSNHFLCNRHIILKPTIWMLLAKMLSGLLTEKTLLASCPQAQAGSHEGTFPSFVFFVRGSDQACVVQTLKWAQFCSVKIAASLSQKGQCCCPSCRLLCRTCPQATTTCRCSVLNDIPALLNL